MKVTVCELSDERSRFAEEWKALVSYLEKNPSDLVLLPEMPFSRWFAGTREFDAGKWSSAVTAHATPEFSELRAKWVATTRPINNGNRRHNEGFVWTKDNSVIARHCKVFLPDEEPVWEASWYEPGPNEFHAFELGEARVGFIICSELWFFDKSREYAKQNTDIVLTPRKTDESTTEKWLLGGRVSAITSGAFQLSSNSTEGDSFGGVGWIIDPDGNVLAKTSKAKPFVTVEINLEEARQAKKTYPRNVIG